MPGYHAASFICAYDDADLCSRVLAKEYPRLVKVGSYYGGKLHYELDLDVAHDRLAAEEMVRRSLERAVSRHRMPSEPPPDEVA